MLRLTLPGRNTPLTSPAEINDALAAVGTRLWPLDLGASPDDIRRLLPKPSLGEAEAARVRAHFLMKRARLLEIVAAAGRTPHVAAGGALETLDATHAVPYPELYQVEPGADYSRFDRFHVNAAEDGTAVDEFMQVLRGTGVRLLQRLPTAARSRSSSAAPTRGRAGSSAMTAASSTSAASPLARPAPRS